MIKFFLLLSLCVAHLSYGKIIDIISFGATPNDGTDDLTAITNAINTSSVGDTVYFPAGTFWISNSIKPKSGTILLGSHRGSTIIQYTGTNEADIVRLDQKTDVEIAQLALDANFNESARNGIVAWQGGNHFIHDLTIKNIANPGFPHGIYFSESVTDCIILHNVIENISVTSEWGGGIRLAAGSARNTVMWNVISNTGRGGILCDNESTNLIIKHNTVSKSGGTGLGIEIWNHCDRTIIEDNTIDSWLSVDRSDYCGIRRNIISRKDGIYKFCGIELAGGCNDIFTDNHVDDGALIGISVSEDEKEYVYWGYNTIEYANTWGVQIQGDADGARYYYFYKNKFLNTYQNHP
jgi:hypothetical protein